MKNKKGFTLMEVLLAAMIVGVIGLALAALTTAAMREGGIGRTHIMLRNQLSVALRQLRFDLERADQVEITEGGKKLKIIFDHVLGPGDKTGWVEYYCENSACSQMKRSFRISSNPGSGFRIGADKWLTNVSNVSSESFVSPSFTLMDAVNGQIESRVRFRVIVRVPSNPPVVETVEEIFIMPHGFTVQYDD